MQGLTKEQALMFLNRLRDFDIYAPKELWIKNKNGEKVPLILNSEQKKVYGTITKLKQEKKPVRLIVLKSRQEGVSTLTEALIFHDSATRKFRNSEIISHDPEATDNLFRMCKFYYENLRPEVRPMKRYSNKTELVFDNPEEKTRLAGQKGLESRITISTANRVEARGSTLHNLHGSEVAFWPNAEDLMLAAMQMVPDNPDTMVVLESTANGVGGYFYNTWVNAINGKNNFTPIFLAWWAFDEYETEVPKGFALTQEEEELKKLYNLTDRKLAWRRITISDKCGGDLNKFRQEYPSCWEEAFITSGTPKFNQDNLRVLYSYRKPPIFVGELAGVWKIPAIIQNDAGRLKIYKWPNAEHKYVVGGDVAKGTPSSDNSCLQVYDPYLGDFVATWHGKEDPTLFATTAAQLGMFYRGKSIDGALLGVEVNKDGITTNRELYHEIGYKNIYKRRSMNKIGEDQQEALGFHTNETSRPLIVNALAEFINEGFGELNDETTLMEMMTFVIMESGKPEAQEGCHDDAVISAGIALFLANYVPIPPKQLTPTELFEKRKKEQKSEEEKHFIKYNQNKKTENW